ncbi:MAG: hypothetical protein EXS08_16140 [Planctomycetes bacterium]|nr:hypothetical protein [Planctomycetota bacterium]
MTPYPLQSGGSAVLVPPRRIKRTRGAPPGSPPERGGGGGGGDGEGLPSGGGADEVGPFALALVLVGISTLFLVLIAVWLFLRRPAPDWRAESGPALQALLLSTLCLLASSVAIERAARLARRVAVQRNAACTWLGASILLGLGFLGAQLALWSALWRAGLVPASSGYAAVFFALTSLHALHVLGGLGFLSALWRRLHGAAPAPAAATSVRLGAVYWHFMGALWLVLFSLLYFVR